MMKQFWICPLTVLFLTSGCSVYRSEGRKQFESEAPAKIKTSSLIDASGSAPFQLLGCDKESRLETWFNEEFPSQNYEVVTAEQDLEVWRTQKKSIVEIKVLQKNNEATLSCIYHFANQEIWNSFKASFIKEVQNNLIVSEEVKN